MILGGPRAAWPQVQWLMKGSSGYDSVRFCQTKLVCGASWQPMWHGARAPSGCQWWAECSQSSVRQMKNCGTFVRIHHCISLLNLSFMRLPPFMRHTFHMICLHAVLLGQVRGCIVAQLAGIIIAASGIRPASHCSIWCLVARLAIALGSCLATVCWTWRSQFFAQTLPKGEEFLSPVLLRMLVLFWGAAAATSGKKSQAPKQKLQHSDPCKLWRV